MNNIIRFGVSIDGKLLNKFDNLISEKGYVNRSEAVRDLIRDKLELETISKPDTEVIGTFTIAYDHKVRDLSDKLNELQHEYHNHIISSVHVHLDQHNCLEVLLLKGKASIVKSIADNLLSIKNVKHGKLTITTTE